MILVESRFRVANDMHDSVRTAFLQRPGLVDDVSGFLGMDVYQASGDASVFHLVTRWTDRGAYDAWHRSDAHHESHAFIPRGLKLDAAFTKLTVMERIESPSMASMLSDSAPVLGAWLVAASTTYAMTLDEAAQSCIVNAALAERLGIPETAEPVSIASLLANDEAAMLPARVNARRAAGTRGTGDAFLLNFVSVSHSTFTLRCRMDVQPTYALMLAEEADRGEDRLRDELMRANNHLATLARERERQRQELVAAQLELAAAHEEVTAALNDLDKSNWHIRRIAELLPMCLDCRSVKSEDGRWGALHEFIMANATSQFLSHGYCPTCTARHLAELGPAA